MVVLKNGRAGDWKCSDVTVPVNLKYCLIHLCVGHQNPPINIVITVFLSSYGL